VAIITAIFDAIYIVIATMTTLGYSDQFPKSVEGKIVTCVMVVTGLFYLTLAIQIVGNAFDQSYEKYLNRLAEKKREQTIDVYNTKHYTRKRQLSMITEESIIHEYIMGNMEISSIQTLASSCESLMIKTKELSNILQLLKLDKISKKTATKQFFDNYTSLKSSISLIREQI